MSRERYSLFVDFDGTITDVDTAVQILERLAPPAWHEIEATYASGAIGSRECIARQWSMIRAERSRIEQIADEVVIDPGFGELVELARSA